MRPDGRRPAMSVHEVALVAVDDVVDDLASELLDARPQQLRVLRREPAADEHLEPVVLWWVHVEHHLTRRHETQLVGIRDHRALGVRAEQPRLAADHPDVLVLGQGPEVLTVGIRVTEHGRVGTQPRVLLPGVAVRKGGRRDQVDVARVHRGDATGRLKRRGLGQLPVVAAAVVPGLSAVVPVTEVVTAPPDEVAGVLLPESSPHAGTIVSTSARAGAASRYRGFIRMAAGYPRRPPGERKALIRH